MSRTIETVIARKGISQTAQLHSEFSLHIGDLDQEVRIRIWKSFDHEAYYFTQSHFIKTPLQGFLHRTSSSYAESPEDALHRALETLVSHYNEAVEAGKAPVPEWLVRNENP